MLFANSFETDLALPQELLILAFSILCLIEIEFGPVYVFHVCNLLGYFLFIPPRYPRPLAAG